MPFGQVFGALFFGLLCTGVGAGLLAGPAAATRLAGVSVLLGALCLALGLLKRRPWARWAGVLSAALMALFALRRASAEESVAALVLLFASLLTLILLALPATARVPRPEAAPRRAEILKLGVVVGLAGVLGAAWLGAPAETGFPADRPSLPASATAKRMRWVDPAQGLEQARNRGEPALLVFVTDWCPYCTKMDRTTWRATSVAQRTAGLITIKIDAEDGSERGGASGRELAARYRVQGYPALVLVDAEGRLLARADGYLSPRQFLSWLDEHLGPGVPATVPVAGATL